jgi:hypothetical protein
MDDDVPWSIQRCFGAALFFDGRFSVSHFNLGSKMNSVVGKLKRGKRRGLCIFSVRSHGLTPCGVKCKPVQGGGMYRNSVEGVESGQMGGEVR